MSKEGFDLGWVPISLALAGGVASSPLRAVLVAGLHRGWLLICGGVACRGGRGGRPQWMARVPQWVTRLFLMLPVNWHYVLQRCFPLAFMLQVLA